MNRIDLDKRILEIGPLCSPMIEKNVRKNVFYADIRSTDEVREFYKNDTSVDKASIRDIDFVVKNSYQKTFSGVEKFDYVLASHVIEHVPQFIRFFQDIATVISAGGFLCLTIPDKRYCFDHFRIPTSFAEMYDVYKQGVKNNPMRVFDFFANAVPAFNDPVFFWSGQDDTDALAHMYPLDTAHDAYERASKGEYMDVHFSVFTPESFLMLLYNMTRAALLPFRCVEFYPTQPDTFEFNVVLQLEISLLLENSTQTRLELDNIKNLLRLTKEGKAQYENKKYDIHDFYEKRAPSDQNIADLFKDKWVSRLPSESIDVSPAYFPGFSDNRIEWLAGQFALSGKKILELGPMEGAHSFMMEKAFGASSVTSIEANTISFLKCLCVKEIFHLRQCNFLLGDFCKYLDVCEDRYDLVLASGVLYHMTAPFSLLKAIARVTDALYLWTHYYDSDLCKKDEVSQYFSHEEEYFIENEIAYPYFKYLYRSSTESELFLGGQENYANWLTRDSIIRYLKSLNFTEININFENIGSVPGPSFSIFAKK